MSAPDGQKTRPTSDRTREALFNLLAHHAFGENIPEPLHNAIVLDAFGGSGALGLEALSRGAQKAVFFEKDRKALGVIRANIEKLSLSGQTHILPIDATRPPQAHEPCSLVFLDPPYRKDLISPTLEALLAKGWVVPSALIVVETAKDEALPPLSGFNLLLERAYGDTLLRFLSFNGT